MAKDASFDVVSEMNMEEVKNAIQMTLRELKNRFDFKGSTVDITLDKQQLTIVGDDDFKLDQIKDVLLGKLVKREVPIKNLHFSETEHALGSKSRQHAELISGIDKENAKKITTAIKNAKLKVKAQIQDDQIRVTGKNRDDLQAVIQLLRKLELPIELQFTNYR
ncbi:YajQ family cyclic di-GMP-binding protein [Candidatus Enterococcus willemsii]|uniref:Nucleotide-binding protein BAU17_13390 n=1 Tax=Candidatus Enterococcus willemsii TaxID=1857215 RepID=A0ABQ6Z2Z0_9ENTE|nr:YajQ family cyclic di-GMP-binding protein [Enterococcus sp. CU12B]KAF1305611.1 YajQ family cyclic di-GMP-binding protein [Enterococcus sp. CU12B]